MNLQRSGPWAGTMEGSPADCLKHSILVYALTEFVQDARPFVYIDTHSGTGIYDLNSPEAKRFQNHQGGVVTLATKDVRSRSLRDYLRLQKVQNVTGRLADIGHCYLGSPVIAQHFLRPQDASLLFEASSPVAQALEENLRPLGRLGPLGPLDATRVCCGSCYRWFSEDLEIPRGSRVLALIDPPYDSASSSDRWNLYLVKQIRERWTDSCLDCQHFSPKDEEVINHQPPWLLGKI